MSIFLNNLSKAVDSGFTMENAKNPLWKEAANSATETDLEKAFETGKEVVGPIFAKMGECRSESKSWERFKQKLNGVKNDDYLKILVDLSAFRVIRSDLKSIDPTIATIENAVKNLSTPGQITVKVDPQFPFFDEETKSYKDLTRFLYIDTKKPTECITEVQVGHPFALYVFKHDSQIRGKQDQVNLWDNNFYSDVKNYILDTTNKPGYRDVEKVKGFIEKATQLYAAKQQEVPADLIEILNAL